MDFNINHLVIELFHRQFNLNQISCPWFHSVAHSRGFHVTYLISAKFLTLLLLPDSVLIPTPCLNSVPILLHPIFPQIQIYIQSSILELVSDNGSLTSPRCHLKIFFSPVPGTQN